MTQNNMSLRRRVGFIRTRAYRCTLRAF